MFLSNSRYYQQPAVTVPGPAGKPVQALTLRRLPSVAGQPHEVVSNDQLDILALATLNDGTKPWAVADANTELDARLLTAITGDVINLPAQG